MKNIIIVALVIIAGAVGYLLYTNSNSPATQTGSNSTNSSSSANSINLCGKNLTKLSVDILDNSSVTKLDVSNNSLTGALPAEIRKLTNLETLDASNNKLTGIPAEIGQLSKLRFVNFSNNDISGLPLELKQLKNLDTLDLRGNPHVSQRDLKLIRQEIPNAKILTD